MVGLPDLGMVVVNSGALDSVVGLADLGLIFSMYWVIFYRSLFLLSSGVVVVNGVRYIITTC